MTLRPSPANAPARADGPARARKTTPSKRYVSARRAALAFSAAIMVAAGAASATPYASDTARMAAPPSAVAAPAAAHAAAPAAAALLVSSRDSRYAQVHSPNRVETSTQFEVKVRLTGLQGKPARKVYRRYRVYTSIKGAPWEMVRRAAVTAKPTHTFTLTAPSVKGGYRVRLELLRPHGERPVLTPPARIAVRLPAPVDLGSPDDWSSISGTNADGSAVRWDPCSPIRWTFNANGTDSTYPQSLEDVNTSLARISAYTGLRFEYLGSTAVVPYASTGGDMHPADDTTPDLFIAFGDRHQVPLFTQGVIGLGGPAYYRTALDKTRWIDTGGVVLNTALLEAMSEVNDSSRVVMRSLITHEVLHAIGLGHASGVQQIMYPYIRENDTFGAGDITGMTIHGSGRGCASGFPERATTVNARGTATQEPLAPVVHHRDDLLHLSH